ncbi:MAG: hypothetical protein ACLTCP_03725 [Ruminococcus bicirculans (ex Wegman et al. 2014)]
MPIVYPFYHGGIIKKVKKVNQVNLTRGIKIFCAKTKNESEIEKSNDFGRKFAETGKAHTQETFLPNRQKQEKNTKSHSFIGAANRLEPVRVLPQDGSPCSPIPPQR